MEIRQIIDVWAHFDFNVIPSSLMNNNENAVDMGPNPTFLMSCYHANQVISLEHLKQKCRHYK